MPDSTRTRSRALFLAALVAGAGWIGYERWSSGAFRAEKAVVASGFPVVMRSPGGLLEIATVTVNERFKRSDSRNFWGFPLGTTVSIIQVPVTYRFHIEMAREWPIQVEGKTAVVRTGEVKPSLPVAIDTTRIEKYTQSGWARFNKEENLAVLERSITAELAQRAQDPALRELATAAGRKTVAEFVTTWLLKEQGWKRDPSYQVTVLFPGEDPARRAPKPD